MHIFFGITFHKNSTVKRAWLGVVFGWVAFWEVSWKLCECWQSTLKRLVLVCRVIRQCLKSSGIFQVVSKQTCPSMMWFEDKPSGSWWACNVRDWREWGVVAGAQGMTMSGSLQLQDKQITSKWEGSRDRAGTKLSSWRKTYKNCFVLPISTKCIFFLVAQLIRTPQLSVFDLK